MGSLPEPLHFVLFPFMAQGHMIPMVDIACLMAQRGVVITIVTTPRNAARFEQPLARAAAAGLHINVLQLKLSAVEAGLPEGCESFDELPTFQLAPKFFHFVNSQYDQVEKLFQQLTPRPSCIISDMCLYYTNKLAGKFQIPRIQFHGFCCFSLLCSHNVRLSGILDRVEWDSEYFTVPDLPGNIQFKANQLPFTSRDVNDKDMLDRLIEAEEASYGVIVNSFEELESEYVNLYKRAKRDKVWCVGPVSLSHKNDQEKAHRGNKASVDEHECLRWLDGHAKGSVVYACLGSVSKFTLSQFLELGLGLEASNRPFIWVIRDIEKKNPEFEKWSTEDGFEKRVSSRGLLIRGWAPQILILSHPAVGTFLTHCGWNSTVEGISSGVPLITWPLFADQFCNEKLAVQVLKVGVSIGVENPSGLGEDIQVATSLVKREDIQKAVEKVMDEGEEGEERRRRVKQLAKEAKKAVDIGGSSHRNITLFIQDITRTNSTFKQY